LLLCAKLIATVACYGTGGCGGIFSPTLFFGAMVGVVISGAVNFLSGMAGIDAPLNNHDIVMLAVVGMSATLGAVVRAPVTSILIVFEMTHQFAIVPPLMLTALISQAVSRSLLKKNFYDQLLLQDGHDVERLRPMDNLRAWQEQAVGALANRRPIILRSLADVELRKIFKAHPYSRFPVVEGSELKGILEREDAERALRENRSPELQLAVVVQPETSLNDVQNALFESPTGILLVQGVGKDGGYGLVTIHDILRAQQAAAENPADF